MRNRGRAGAMLVLFATLLVGCQSGPDRYSREYDDFVNQKYTENAWLHGVLLQDVLPLYPLGGLFVGLVDTLFVNPWYFWGSDVWDNRGTGFRHLNPQTDKFVRGDFVDDEIPVID